MNKKQIEISQFLKLHSCKIHKCICICNTHIYAEQTTHQLYFKLILPDNFTRVRTIGQVNTRVNSERQSLSSRRTMIFLFYKFLCRSNPVRISTFLIVGCFGWNYNPPANHITGLFKQEVDQWWAPALLKHVPETSRMSILRVQKCSFIYALRCCFYCGTACRIFVPQPGIEPRPR